MGIVRQVLQQVEQFLRIGVGQRVDGYVVAARVVLAVDAVGCQDVEVTFLVEFGIHTFLGFHRHKHGVGLIIHGGMLHEMIEQRDGLRHVLAQSVEADGDIPATHLDVVVTCQFIELLLNLLSRERVCAEEFQILRSIMVAQVGLFAEVIAERQLEAAVLGVLDIHEG